MKNWSRFSLAEISESCLGKMLDEEKNVGTLQPYLANINVRWGGFNFNNLGLMKFEEHEIERYGVNDGDLIICEGGEPGRCAIWRNQLPNMKIQKALHRLRVKPGFSVEFLYYRMLQAGKNGELERYFIGSTIKHLTGHTLRQIEFDFPTKEDQIKISSVLSAIDKKIEFNNRINAELEAMAKILYDYWFVQFDFPDANGKPYKTSGGKMVYNPTLKRDIPDGWDVTTIGEYAEVKKGDLITAKDANEGSVKVIAAGVDYSYMHSESNRKENTITISGSGANAGYINFWREPIFASDCITVRGNTDVETILLLQHLRFIQDHITSQSSGSAQPHVYPSDIKILKYVVPPRSVIEAFKNLIIPANTKIANNIFQNESLSTLRDWLLPMLMNGQVTVK